VIQEYCLGALSNGKLAASETKIGVHVQYVRTFHFHELPMVDIQCVSTTNKT